MYLYGEQFLKGKMSIWCVLGEVTVNTNSIWKWDGKIGFNIPDMGESIPLGEHPCQIQASVNGQQWFSGPVFKYKSLDRNLTAEDLRKLDEEEAKQAAKKAPPKKK